MPILSKHVLFLNLIFGVRVILAYWEGVFKFIIACGRIKGDGFFVGGFLSGYGRRRYCIVLLKKCLVVFQDTKKIWKSS